MSFHCSYVVKHDGTFCRYQNFSSEERANVAILNLVEGGPMDIDSYFPFIEELKVKNLYKVDVKKCYNLKKIISKNTANLEIGKIRPEIYGSCEILYLEQEYDFFPSLSLLKMIIEK